MAEGRAMGDRAAVPLTVVGGYLGSGKTTLVNAALRGAHGLRIAVVVNDFGSVNIDAELIRSRTATTLELENGCVCCSLADGMATTMTRLAALDPAPDHVLVELSGVGDPAKMAPWMGFPGFTAGGVLVCADAETVRRRATDRWVGETVLHQLSGADLILLTKTDLVTGDEAEAVRHWLTTIVPHTPIATTAPETGSPEDTVRLLLDAPLTDSPVRHTEHPEHPEDTEHATHHTWSAETLEPVDREALLAALDALPEAVVRVKGILRLADTPDRRTVLQAVGRRRTLTDDGPWPNPDEPSRIVAISTQPAPIALAPLFAHIPQQG